MLANRIHSRAVLRVPKYLSWVSGRWKSKESDDPPEKKEHNKDIVLPPEPTYCCNTGCPDCVWIKYAQELTQLFDNGDVIAKNKIMEKVKDPKLRAFLFTQLGLKERG